MPNLNDLQALLQNHFNGPLAATFATFGGVDVTLLTTEPTLEEQIGKPCLLLEIESDSVSRWNGARGSLRDVVVRFTAQASDFSGATVGAANPTPAQVLISRAFQDYVAQNALALHIAGYMMPEMRMERSTATDTLSTVSGRFLWTNDEAI